MQAPYDNQVNFDRHAVPLHDLSEEQFDERLEAFLTAFQVYGPYPEEEE
jgi:hypothetical protein